MIKTAGLSSLGPVILELERVLAAFESAMLVSISEQVGLPDACRYKLWNW